MKKLFRSDHEEWLLRQGVTKGLLVVSAVLAGSLFLGGLISALVDVKSVLTPRISCYGTSVVLAAWLLYEIGIARWPICLDAGDGIRIEVNRLGSRMRYGLIGVILMVWLPWILFGFEDGRSTGSQIAFASIRDGNPEIYVVDAETGANSVNLTNDGADDWTPAWSPDGKRLAFASYRDGNNAEIYIMNGDGGKIERITATPENELFPAWSPDGREIASMYGKEMQYYDIYVMDANGNNRRNLTKGVGYNWAPSWSPDGSRISFHSFRNGENSDVFVMDADTGDHVTRLTTDPAEDSFPDWSPDGQRIAFVSNRLGNHEIFTMLSDGRNQLPLTRYGEIRPDIRSYNPSWSSNGNWIVFHSSLDADDNSAGNREIYAIRSDGTERVRITNNLASDSDPDWSPNVVVTMPLQGFCIWLSGGLAAALLGFIALTGRLLPLRRRRGQDEAANEL